MRKSLEAIGLVALAMLVWMTYQAFAGSEPLPDRIPTHFDMAGNPNGWGSPAMLILLPVLAVALYLVMTVVSRFPSAFNYSVRVTAENRIRLQELTLNMLAWIKTELACMFAVLQWWMIQAARNGQGRLPPLLTPGFIVLILATAGWHIVAVLRAASAKSG
ncbi:MAG: DUF1648 domain-containing protein [Terracidiphilus sp.]